MAIQDTTILESPEIIDVDGMMEELESIQENEVVLEAVTFEEPFVHAVHPRPTHRPSWGGKLEAPKVQLIEIDPAPFRCGR